MLHKNLEKHHPHPSRPEGVKNWLLFVSPVKTGVQSICNLLKTLDSGFRRNDVKQHGTKFFTPSPSEGEGFVVSSIRPELMAEGSRTVRVGGKGHRG